MQKCVSVQGDVQNCVVACKTASVWGDLQKSVSVQGGGANLRICVGGKYAGRRSAERRAAVYLYLWSA